MDNSISNSETVARILKKDWFDDGKLMHVAFALRNGETYISVNRLSSESYESDVREFVSTHPDYFFGKKSQEYCRADLNVGEVRDIRVVLEEKSIDIDVDVEPRNIHVKSHAGIFTRHNSLNLKLGSTISLEDESVVSTDDILLKVRLQLLHKSQCQQVKFASDI